MARGARQPFDTAHYETLKAQGLNQAAIAKQMELPVSTLQSKLKAQGPPRATHRETVEPPATGRPKGDKGRPPLYVHPGIPDEIPESPVSAEDIAEVPHALPALPAMGIPEGAQGPPVATLSAELAEALTATWPELVDLVAWWRARHQAGQETPKKLERATYHVEPRWVEAVKREADKTGESYAAVVNRAFAQYFAGKST
jgi:hypothetical protein